MNEDELRALVRAAIQRHIVSAAAPGSGDEGIAPQADVTRVSMSFAQYSLERSPDDTTCIIEPAVRCNHCGFCKCHGY